MAAAVGSILETLDKKPPKAITKFQTPCSEGESKRDPSLFVTAIQASLSVIYRESQIKVMMKEAHHVSQLSP